MYVEITVVLLVRIVLFRLIREVGTDVASQLPLSFHGCLAKEGLPLNVVILRHPVLRDVGNVDRFGTPVIHWRVWTGVVGLLVLLER